MRKTQVSKQDIHLLTSPNYLKLGFGVVFLALGSLDCLHEAKTFGLDLLEGGVLIGHHLPVCLLKTGNSCLEGLLGFFHLLLGFPDELFEFVTGHVHEFGDLRLLLVVAQINVGR